MVAESVMLTSEDDYDSWFEMTKTFALAYAVWHLINPATTTPSEETLVEPEKPTNPRDPSYALQVEDWRRQTRLYDR